MKKYSFILALLLIVGNLSDQTEVKAQKTPLYVVDGIITKDISAISPDDVISMYIYKDDAATNIYGEQGKDGVVLINTKQGEGTQYIRSFTIERHDVAWYESQAYAWKQRTIANPQDEEAWMNYFKATRYSEMESGDNLLPRAQAVAEDMKAAIPGTYTYYTCMNILTRFIQTEDTTDYGKLSMETLPAKVGEDEIFDLLGYLWINGAADDSTSGNHAKWLQLLNQQYKNRAYPERVLRYIHNQFLGMERDGLYFANGDMALLPAKLLQDAMGVQKDKQVIVISFLVLDEYRDALFAKLGIAPFVPSREFDLRVHEV